MIHNWRKNLGGLLVPGQPRLLPPSTCAMFKVNHLIGFGAGGAHPTLREASAELGLTTDQKLCLDAGDQLSYAGGTKWLDRSVGGYDFFLGNDATVGAAEDPTFVGTYGGRSDQYFSLDGTNDQFAYDTTVETWMSAMHQDGFLGTIFWVYHAGAGVGANFGSTIATTSADHGIELSISTGGSINFSVFKGIGGNAAAAFISDATVPTGRWNAVAVSINENGGAGASFFWANGGYVQKAGADTFDGAYSAPSASAATRGLMLGHASGYTANRWGMVGIWQGTMLSKANLDALFGRIRGRYAI